MMVGFRQLVLSLASFIFLQFNPPQSPETHGNKSIAIVGAGSAGLAMLRALVDLQDSHLDIVLYEQRRDVGGIWLPDPLPVHPPELPETPLYPNLHTNVPIPAMTYPGFTFPPGTPLFPRHEYVEEYHRDFASHYNLWPYILLNHTVLSTSWVGTSEEGFWDVAVTDHTGHETRRSFDHLVVANGHNHDPHVPPFPGQDEWLRHGKRQILHSIFYRDPQQYANQTVIVVGSGASGRDAASQIVLYAHKVYHSVRTPQDPATGPVEVKPAIAHFTHDAVVFTDGSRAYDVDSIILATGYDLRIPFLEASGAVLVKPNVAQRDDRALTTNLRYLFPLHQHIFSLSPSYPTNALAFIGLPIHAFSCPSDFAQSTYVAKIITNTCSLKPRKALLEELDASEDDLRSRGYDPYDIGHRMVDGSTFDYQEGLIDTLKAQGAIPDDGVDYVEAWRRDTPTYTYLKRGWQHVEELERQEEWLSGVETEAEWADLMRRLNSWQKEWEEREGSVFSEEQTIF